MKLTRRQIVEGGLVAGFLGLGAKPAFAAIAEDPMLRRRPDGSLASTIAGTRAGAAAPMQLPHPGQPITLRPQPVGPQVVARPLPVPAQPRVVVASSVNPRLVAAARASFDKHRHRIRHGEVIGIVDFNKSSRDPRYYLLDTNSGRVSEHHVSHGRGSDPEHTGWLRQFSNRHGSLASSDGGYVTGDTYHGKYGLSMRLHGLDWSNSNAYDRAIVIHPAWYAEPSHLAMHGLLGRSEGCFAMSRTSLRETLGRLGPGHFLYASRA